MRTMWLIYSWVNFLFLDFHQAGLMPCRGRGGHWEQWREIHLGISSYWALNLIPHSQSENRKQPFLNQPSFVTSTFSYMEESLLGIYKSHFQSLADIYAHQPLPFTNLFQFWLFFATSPQSFVSAWVGFKDAFTVQTQLLARNTIFHLPWRSWVLGKKQTDCTDSEHNWVGRFPKTFFGTLSKTADLNHPPRMAEYAITWNKFSLTLTHPLFRTKS